MNDNKVIPVFYACDDNFVKYTVVSLQSMKEHASRDQKYCIHVLHTNISKEMQDVMYAMQDEQFQIRFDDVTDYLKSISDKLPLRDYYSKTTYFRLFIVEKVLGIDRNAYFNAGLLVINCEQFRKQCVLDQFIELLHVYNFVVTQDEDYLNLICKGQVFWLPQQWNTEVFGNIDYPEESICVLHYIMVSKPWHYKDCRMGAYFWEYAKKTVCYEEILEVLENYTDEQRAEDAASADRLMVTAQNEIDNENNYLNLLNRGQLKAKDRLEVLEKIAQLEREGRFDEDVEEDPPT